MKKSYLILLFTIALCGCNKSVEISGFDTEKWQNDVNGCQGHRMKIIDVLMEQKTVIQGLNQTEIVNLLGKPDRNELYKRSQKFFEYQISPDKLCNANQAQNNTYLSIRFNATGLAKEILVYKE